MRPADNFEDTMEKIMKGLSNMGVQPSAGRGGGQRRQAAARATAARTAAAATPGAATTDAAAAAAAAAATASEPAGASGGKGAGSSGDGGGEDALPPGGPALTSSPSAAKPTRPSVTAASPSSTDNVSSDAFKSLQLDLIARIAAASDGNALKEALQALAADEPSLAFMRG